MFESMRVPRTRRPANPIARSAQRRPTCPQQGAAGDAVVRTEPPRAKPPARPGREGLFSDPMTVEITDLVKHFTVHHRDPGLRASVRGVFRRQRSQVKAVDGISFSIAPGEVVGFLGPNGAGKTTTLKCLAGLLHPSSGSVKVLGHEPFRRENEFLSRISLVMGQRNSLFWDLPAHDAFEVHRRIYRIEPQRYRRTLDELVQLLELQPLLSKQVRVLSQGERMRCELAASLLHEPDVIFLDEPTLGLDVNAQAQLRSFLGEHNGRRGSTILLTSHYMADVTALARRVLVIDSGTLHFDGDLAGLGGAARTLPAGQGLVQPTGGDGSTRHPGRGQRGGRCRRHPAGAQIADHRGDGAATDRAPGGGRPDRGPADRGRDPGGVLPSLIPLRAPTQAGRRVRARS